MSLFDPPTQDKLSDDFGEGQPFWLLRAKFEGVQPTAYGDSPQAAIVACPPSDMRAAKQYRVWGTLAEQVQQMEPGDTPAEVAVVKSGRKNVWRLVTKLPPGTGLSATAATEFDHPPAASTEQEEPPF